MVDAPLRAERALGVMYPPRAARKTLGQLRALVAARRAVTPAAARWGPLAAGDCLVVAYPDHIRAPGEPPLATLRRFLDEYAADIVTGVHVLPFYPSSSDEGFAVTDYEAVAPAFGDWAAVSALAARYRLMVDLVLNHASAQGAWFRRFAAGDPAFARRFVTVAGAPDLTAVVRPRTTPLLTEVATSAGPQRVWTTFGPDQADLDYRDPATLLAMVEVLLGYVDRGASLVRLDAVAFLWKEPGTSCLHLPQTHAAVRFLRAVLDMTAPDVLLVTETNVPHAENVAYFGAGDDEAQLVYNFALPPLALHTMVEGDASCLSEWAGTLAAPSRRATFLNFLASHDGIGLRPVAGILSDADLARLVDRVVAGGGQVSWRASGDGREAYELNTNFLDALVDGPTANDEAAGVARFLCAHAIAMALVGVPLLYLHSLLGSRGWPGGAAAGGPARAVNRERLGWADVTRALGQPASRRARVRAALAALAAARRAAPAFDPWGRQTVLDLGPACFAVRRVDPTGGPAVLCLHNVTADPLTVGVPSWTSPRPPLVASGAHAGAPGRLDLDPYGYAWLAIDD